MSVRDADVSRRRFMKLAGAATVMAMAGQQTPAWAAAASTKIGIIGSGNVGGALGRSWLGSGHEVMFSSRNLDHDKALVSQLGARAHAGTPGEAALFGEVLLIAVPYRALPDVGKSLKEALAGKVVIDACNPFPSRDGEIADWARQKGAGLASAELLPGARVVRAFNAVSAARMEAARQAPGKVGMPIAGDDARAIAVVSSLIRDIGYEPVLIGNLAMGRYLMPGTPLAGERTADEIRKIAATLQP